MSQQQREKDGVEQQGDDEEWRRSEEALRRLNISCSSSTSANTVPPPPVAAAQGGGGNEQIFIDTPVPHSKGNDFIDDALSDTLQNPQERMNVLKFENKILHFVKSSDKALNVPPMSNSFHRLLVYRIAQRFQLEHTYADSSLDSGSQGFTIYKTPYTVIPSPLLIEIPLKEQASNVQNNYKMPQGVVGGSIQKEGGNKKPVLMKRDKNNKGKKHNKSKSETKTKDNMSDKEKMYAAARARIFGLEGDNEESGGSSSNSETQQSSTHCNNSTVAPINTSEKKVTYRDRQAEMFDPDFIRQGPQAPLSAPGFVNNGHHEQPTTYQHQPQAYYNNPYPQSESGYSHGGRYNENYNRDNFAYDNFQPMYDNANSINTSGQSNMSSTQQGYDHMQGGFQRGSFHNPSPPLPQPIGRVGPVQRAPVGHQEISSTSTNVHSLNIHGLGFGGPQPSQDCTHPHSSLNPHQSGEPGSQGRNNLYNQQSPFTLDDFPKLS